MDAVIVPTRGVPVGDLLPLRRRRGRRVDPEGNRSALTAPVDIGRLRVQVLEDTIRTDPKVRLTLVAQHGDLGRAAIGELEPGPEVDDPCADSGGRGRDRNDPAAVVRGTGSGDRVRGRGRSGQPDDHDRGGGHGGASDGDPSAHGSTLRRARVVQEADPHRAAGDARRSVTRR